MEQEIFWPKLKQAFGNQKVFWATSELMERPNTTDRLLHYLISYYETPSIARNCIRIFRGISPVEGFISFSGWNEVRVSTIRQIDDAIRYAGGSGATWDLALTIKDFLQNMWVTLDTVNLSEVDMGSMPAYIKQLRAIPNSWFITDEKGKKITADIPLRSKQDKFYKHFKRYRKFGEPVLPESALDYLEYLWKLTTKAPFEHHANRIMSRLGVMEDSDPISVKLTKFELFTTTNTPVTKHKLLVQLGKMVCFDKKPRCMVCPVSAQCSKKGVS